MRLFYFIVLFTIPSLVYGQTDCTEDTFNNPAPFDNTYACTSLSISEDGMNKTADGNPYPLIINVSGDVAIKGNIILDGGHGPTIISDGTNGADAGPGGYFGGGLLSNSPQSGGYLDPSDGSPGTNDIVCSSGGGGAAGANSDGIDGSICSLGSSFGLKGVSYLSFPGIFIGGFGGGAGGESVFGSGFDLGGGGGGGGGLLINATGKITIADGVRISARGGNGGNSVDLGGAGGGGGGGNIHLIAAEINNKGIFDVRGGNGGINTRASLPKGGNGGAGGNGIIRFEINGAITDVTGIQDYSSGLPTSTTQSLKSSISCGTILPKNNDSKMFFQMLTGFFIVMMMSALLKTLSRFPKKF